MPVSYLSLSNPACSLGECPGLFPRFGFLLISILFISQNSFFNAYGVSRNAVRFFCLTCEQKEAFMKKPKLTERSVRRLARIINKEHLLGKGPKEIREAARRNKLKDEESACPYTGAYLPDYLSTGPGPSEFLSCAEPTSATLLMFTAWAFHVYAEEFMQREGPVLDNSLFKIILSNRSVETWVFDVKSPQDIALFISIATINEMLDEFVDSMCIYWG